MCLGSGAGWMSASTSLTWRSPASAGSACCFAPARAAPAWVLGIDDNVVLLDVDRERLGDVGAGHAPGLRRGRLGELAAPLDGHLVALDAGLAGTQERLAGGEAVFPPVP